jgi:hypothetical protein
MKRRGETGTDIVITLLNNKFSFVYIVICV